MSMDSTDLPLHPPAFSSRKWLLTCLTAGRMLGIRLVSDAGWPGAAKVNPLTPEQQELVRDNLGLIGVHLRRFVPGLARPKRDREWPDLFQEGCLGLIRAAVDFDPARGIPFAAFALPRIHQAVSRALQEKFTMIARPKDARRRRGKRGRKEADPNERPGNAPLDPSSPPSVRSLSDSPVFYALSSRQNPTESPSGETIGDRLRGKYERALRHAAQRVQSVRAAARDDRPELIHRLVEERLLVPRTEARKALRRIARETGSSYARVADYEKKMIDMVRESLSADPEFVELRERSRHNPVGVLLELDDHTEADLAKASAAEFVRRFESADRSERSAMIEQLLDASPAGVKDVLANQIAGLPPEIREQILRPFAKVDGGDSSGGKSSAGQIR